MDHAAEKVVLVTGASSGFGKLTARRLAAQGHVVYATMRDPLGRNRPAREEFLAIAEREQRRLSIIDIDVTDDESVSRGIDAILEETGRIDVLVNNAGVMNVGVSEVYTLEEVQRQFDVNFFGVVRMNRAVLPHMRERRSGLLIQVSSLVGRVVLPFFGVYTASKFAVEALAESYRYELSSFGVDSVIVEPGPFRTKLFANSPANEADPQRLASYGDVASVPSAILSSFTELLTSEEAPDPESVATAIAELVDMPGERPLRTVVGLDFGVNDLNDAVEPVQQGFLEALGLGAAAAAA